MTQLAFSHDGRHLLSASRDRSFAVFRRRDDSQPGAGLRFLSCQLLYLAVATGVPVNNQRIGGASIQLDQAAVSTCAGVLMPPIWQCLPGCAGEPPFALLAKVAKAHQRMVLGAAWAPGDALFATASRDSSVKLWTMSESGAPLDLSTLCCT